MVRRRLEKGLEEYFFPKLRDLVVNVEGDIGYGEWKNFSEEGKMKVKCKSCGLVFGKCLSLDCVCPECGSNDWYRLGPEEKINEAIEELNKPEILLNIE